MELLLPQHIHLELSDIVSNSPQSTVLCFTSGSFVRQALVILQRDNKVLATKILVPNRCHIERCVYDTSYHDHVTTGPETEVCDMSETMDVATTTTAYNEVTPSKHSRSDQHSDCNICRPTTDQLTLHSNYLCLTSMTLDLGDVIARLCLSSQIFSQLFFRHLYCKFQRIKPKRSRHSRVTCKVNPYQ